MGNDICIAIREFFSNGQLLKEVNATIITLLPKVTTPDQITYFRPISCCNFIYKSISKIISDRLLDG